MPDALVAPRDIVRSGLCIGCGICVSGVPDAAMAWDRDGQLKPAGPAAWYAARTPAFSATCPFSPTATNEDTLAAALYPAAPMREGRIGRYEAAYVGAAAEGDYRPAGSSGGMVSWVAAELLRLGLVDGVAHVVAADAKAEGRLFKYRISRTVDEVRQGAKSRYYPTELSDVLASIRATPGRYAVVGIPCFIKAVNLLRREDPVLADRVAFTLGLYCGHMKSARMVESFAWQMGIAPADVAAIDFRHKNPTRPANWYTAELTLTDGRKPTQDWWPLADGDWGAGFFQNAACDFCDDVVAETADISFGDAWVEPYSSDGRGTNVVVVRSPALHAIVRSAMADGRLDLAPVNSAFVVETQAAGFRHRREGLALRLADRRASRRAKGGVQPVKRVPPVAPALPIRRKLVYRMRRATAALSHPIFRAARRLNRPGLYLRWARATLHVYQALAWSGGRLGKVFDRIAAIETRRSE